jgi:hypothetical protein
VNHAQVCIISLPSGAVKTVSTGTLEALSREADPPVAKVQLAQHAVLEAANKAENQINHMKKNVQSFFELTQPFNKIYQACVQGRDEQPAAAGLVLEQNRVAADPAVFDAMATFNERTYLLQGDMYWLYLPGQDEAEGPFAISDEFGKDDRGQPLAGPFDAACVVDGRLGLFQGDQFFVSTAGEDTQAQGPHPIKNYWGSDNQEMQLDGLFDAVTLYADRLYIRKGELYWDQPVGGIKALNERRSD